MLASVTSYDTPDPLTFVVHLGAPVAPFMDYLAAPYGPKVSSAATLTAHAGSDMAQTYLKTHDAGTGPFTMSDFVPADHYTLTAFPNYWGGKPAISQLHITILPDISTQQLKLQNGDLQMIIHGLAKNDIASYEHNPKFQVQRFPANFKNMLMVNQNKGIFKSLPLRNALQGEPASPLRPPSGCPFHPRCDVALDSCSSADAALLPIGRRSVACVRAGELEGPGGAAVGPEDREVVLAARH